MNNAVYMAMSTADEAVVSMESGGVSPTSTPTKCERILKYCRENKGKVCAMVATIIALIIFIFVPPHVRGAHMFYPTTAPSATETPAEALLSGTATAAEQ